MSENGRGFNTSGANGAAGQVGRLGFGMMRLPRKGVRIDHKYVSQMVDGFLEAGFNYFDTAYIYPGSEDATRKALVKRHPRESFYLATKLFSKISPTASMAKKQLHTSLKRLGTSYIDYYLLHSLNDSAYKRYERLGLWEFVAEQKAAGVIRQAGFSFHGGPKVLEEILSDHPEVDFVQLQLNYADWESPRVQSRANWEVARAHDVPIVVMEPVKGGALVRLPADVKQLFDRANPQASYASWAIRYAASLPGVVCVLSGMSDLDQLHDNIKSLRDFQPLSEEERNVVETARKMLESSNLIACTSCGYCVKDCPQHIPIPELFAAMNTGLEGAHAEAQQAYSDAVAGARKAAGAGDAECTAGSCIACGRCEQVCTQGLPVIEYLRTCASTFES